MKVGKTKVGTRTVLIPDDSLTGENSLILEEMFNQVPKGHKTEVIIDFKAVEYMDSQALERLLNMHDELNRRGGRLKIICPGEVCRDIFTSTRLITILSVFDDMQKAIKG